LGTSASDSFGASTASVSSTLRFFLFLGMAEESPLKTSVFSFRKSKGGDAS
jgi:hypothetical protein